MSPAPVIVGVGQTPFAFETPASEQRLAGQAILAALADAGLRPADVDGVVRFDREAVWELELTHGLGVRDLAFYNAVPYGAGSAPALVRMAAMAIGAGLATVVVAYHARNRPTDLRPLLARAPAFPPDAVAEVVVALHQHARGNPRALVRQPPATEVARAAAGACCLVLSTAERPAPHAPVRVLSSMQAVPPLAERATRELWARAGIGPADVDVACLYDAVPALVLQALEDYGLCPRGAARLAARPVVNPHGGQLCEAHLDGINDLTAAVRALRAGARTALVAGSPLEPTSAVVLAR